MHSVPKHVVNHTSGTCNEKGTAWHLPFGEPWSSTQQVMLLFSVVHHIDGVCEDRSAQLPALLSGRSTDLPSCEF